MSNREQVPIGLVSCITRALTNRATSFDCLTTNEGPAIDYLRTGSDHIPNPGTQTMSSASIP